ncbi:SDR family NAD(P)-dependent oxidoreductase, partial [Microbispora sp. RL4-1S]
NHPEPHTALTAAAHLHTTGTPITWPTTTTTPHTVDLPTYAFQSRRHWVDQPKTAQSGAATDDPFWETVGRGDLDGLVRTLGAEGERVQEALGEVLPALTSWHTARNTRSVIDSWRHRIVWRPVENEIPLRPGGPWLIVRTEDGPAVSWSDTLTRALEERDTRVVSVVVGRGGDGHTDAERLAHALAAMPADGPYTGVLSLLALDEHAGLAADSDAVALINALDDAGISGRLWIATSGAVAAAPSDQVIRPSGGLVWGLGGVIAAERPERWGGLVDIPGGPDTRSAEYVLTALMGTRDESELAVRTSGLLARRLVRAPRHADAPAAEWSPDGTVLVTGGTGALGALVARRLARRGVPHLLLVSRRGPGAPGADRLRADLTALGARVTIAACDVGDREALSTLLATVPGEHPLTAVVHTAAVLDDGLLSSLTPERIAAVHRVKVAGALNLHELTRDLPLSAFVLFSSVTGTLANAGQGNYAPGNAFLDALADHRRSLGLPATSIAWGHWDGDGIAGDEARESLRRGGFPPMSPDLAVTALEETVCDGQTRLIVARADWTTVLSARSRPLLRELPEAGEAAVPASATGEDAESEGENLMRRLLALPESERRPTARAVVREQIAEVLGHASAAEVDDDRGFRDQGFTSLSAVELRNRLARLTDTTLPTTLVFDYPTPAALLDHLLAVLLPQPEPPRAAVLAKIDELEEMLAVPLPEEGRGEALTRLRRLLDAVSGAAVARSSAGAGLGSATDDELITFISNELGIS